MAPPKKTTKMSLGDFLSDETFGSWADEMEDMPTAPSSGHSTGYGNRRDRDRDFNNDRYGGGGYGGGGGFGGGRQDREDRFSHRPELPLPTKPPFTAHVGNLSFDATEDDLSQFFEACSVSNVRLVRDKLEDRPKGFGYVEFSHVDGLKKALELNNSQLAGRNVRVSVADPPKERPDDRTNVDNWRRAGPLPPAEPSGRRPSRFNDNSSDAGGERFERRHSGFDRGDRVDRGDRAPGEGSDGKIRDFNNWERKGPLPPLTPTDAAPQEGNRPPRHEKGDRRRSPAQNPFDRERQPSFQQGRAGHGHGGQEDTGYRREYQRPSVSERVPTAAERDNEWRKGPRAEPTGPPSSAPSAKERSVPTSPIVPKTRPKLELKKRSEAALTEVTASASSADPKSSPFGAARPIDTDQKLREIEEKHAAAAAEKKAREEKAKEEKKAARAAANAEKAAQKGSKDREGEATAGKNYDILRRASAYSEGNSGEPDVEADESKKDQPKAVEQTKPTDTKAKPQRGHAAPPAEEDGWSTVGSRRRGGANGKA